MQRRFRFTSGLMMLSAFQICFAQSFDSNSWIDSEYGIHGRPYRSVCRDVPKPGGSAPTVKEAIGSFVCAEEHLAREWGPLILIDNPKIKIGIGRPFDKVADAWFGDSTDHSALVYPLRGSFTLYECVNLTIRPESPAHSYKAGENCNSVEQPEATGICYKAHNSDNSGGNWVCRLKFKVENFEKGWDDQWTHRGVPPPTAK